MTNQKFQQIPLKEIILSGDNKRQIDEHSDDFEELKASIVAGGIRVPIQVLALRGEKTKYELRAGQRRYKACKNLGLVTIPAIVYDEMNDHEALDLTYIENKFRKDLKPMEEAAEIAMLMERLGGNAKLIAKKIGKSEQWVRVRANIISGLSKPWQTIFNNLTKHTNFDSWTISHLFQIARLPEYLQVQIYKELTMHYAGSWDMTAKDLEEKIAKIMQLLTKAKWELDDETLIPKVGACSKCPERSGHQPLLWFDTEEQIQAGDQCLDLSCWQHKELAWIERKAKDLKDKHPNLIYITKEYPNNTESELLHNKFGDILQNWEYKSVSQSTKGAIPAMYVHGKASGQLKYVQLKVQSKHQYARKGLRTLKERQAMLDAKRWAQMLLDLRKKVAATQVSQITYKDKIAGVMVLAAYYGNERLWHAQCDLNKGEIEKLINSKNGQDKALELLWQSFIPTLDRILTWSGPVTQTPKYLIKEIEWIAALIDVDFKAMFKDICKRKGFTIPKSWSDLNADGTPKTKKVKAGKTTKKTSKERI